MWGKFTDENNMPAGGVLYGATVGQCSIFITNRGLSHINYVLKAKETKAGTNKLIKSDSISYFKYDIERVDILLDGANISITQAQERRVSNNEISYNYYTIENKDGAIGLHPSKEILLKNVYEGIDWSVQIITGENGMSALKYNFIVRPGSNIEKIKLRYSKNAYLLLDLNQNNPDVPSLHFKEFSAVVHRFVHRFLKC